METYIDPILKKYKELIETNNKAIKAFYYGDPIRVPASNLPACILSKTETRIGNETNAEDEHGIMIRITIITDIRSDLNFENEGVVAGVNSLYNIIEGRESDYTLKSSSILDILRSNVAVDTAQNLRTDLSTITRADYGMTVGKRAPEAWATEGEVEFVAHFIQNR